MFPYTRIIVAAATAAVGALVCLAPPAGAVTATGAATPGPATGSTQQVIMEPVCRGEFAPVTYDYTWRATTVALPTGGIHIDLWQRGSVDWSQDGVTYRGPFTQSQSQDYARQDVLRDDLTVEAAGTDDSHVHAWVRIIGQIRDGVPQVDQWDVGVSC